LLIVAQQIRVRFTAYPDVFFWVSREGEDEGKTEMKMKNK
jgi:hypothetical protein